MMLLVCCLQPACGNQSPTGGKKTPALKIQKIAFHSDRDGNAEIYSIHADGTNETRLTNDEADDRFPSWSPDGSKILFQSDRNGERGIYIMNADGSDVRKIKNTDGGNYAKWSRDGTMIAFFADIDGNTEIALINADGTNQTEVTGFETNDENPSISPDGSRIVFQSY